MNLPGDSSERSSSNTSLIREIEQFAEAHRPGLTTRTSRLEARERTPRFRMKWSRYERDLYVAAIEQGLELGTIAAALQRAASEFPPPPLTRRGKAFRLKAQHVMTGRSVKRTPTEAQVRQREIDGLKGTSVVSPCVVADNLNGASAVEGVPGPTARSEAVNVELRELRLPKHDWLIDD